MIKIKLIKSPIGLNPKARLTIKALGLNKINKTRELDENNPAINGMVRRVRSFIQVEKLKK